MGNGESLLMGTGFPFGGDEMFSNLIVVVTAEYF